jgi:hypothetical protein
MEIICFWTGDTPMSDARKGCLLQMTETIGYPVCLVTKDMVPSLLHPDYPIHPAYPYLSETHKADYLRTYWMHVYGGGYSDIKRQTGSWKQAIDTFQQSDAYITGYREGGEGAIACPEVRHEWASLIGNCAYVCKPGTPFTTTWFNRMNALLDQKLDSLRQHPATFAQDCAERGGGYPLEWNEMLGRIFHKVCYEFRDRIAYDIPIVQFTDYK